MEGVYVVAPTVESIEAIKADFKSPSEALYKKVHLFFLLEVSREMMNSIKQCPTLISRIKTFKARISEIDDACEEFIDSIWKILLLISKTFLSNKA